MIEREAGIKVYNETLGAKGAKGRLVRVSPEGFYEVTPGVRRQELTTPPPDPVHGDPGRGRRKRRSPAWR